MRVVLVSTFFPNSSDPFRAVFLRNLATAMATQARITVISPIPYAPPWPTKPEWTALRAIASRDTQNGIEIRHPRFAVIPKAESLTGATYGQGIRATLIELMREGGVDVVHAHCAYPDSVGAALIAAQLKLPFVMTAHGSDINVYAAKPTIRPQLRWAMRQAASVIGVSRQICEKLAAIAPDRSDRIEQIPCAGVDPVVFAPRDRGGARARCGVEAAARVVTFVGQLVPIKNLSLLVQAWAGLLAQGAVGPRDRLILIGEGPLRAGLEREVAAPAFAGTVKFLGPLPQPQIAQWLTASDLLCLPSRNEGMPNVIVEALACGVPVVATAVGGIPDLIEPTVNGLLVPAGDVTGLTRALAEALSQKWDAEQIAASVSGYTWPALAVKNLQVLARAMAR